MRAKNLLNYLFLTFSVLIFCREAVADKQVMFFEQHIRPVLVEHCYKCHSAESGKSKGGLLVDSRDGLLSGGDTGPAIVPGNLEKSLLIEAIRYSNRELQMPEKKQLPQSIVEKFEQWVQNGAYDPRVNQVKVIKKDRMKDGRRNYWSFQPLQKTSPPSVQQKAWVKTDIDSFILSQLESKNLKPAGQADANSFLRRLSLDLIGLPPSLEDLVGLSGSFNDQKIEMLIDQLLASDQFGIKWSRFWLDMARYSETAGGGRSYPIPSAWRYRNYVIDAFNQDLPYNQFIKEQIAGDLLPFENEKQKARQLIATGFMVLGAKPLDQADKVKLNFDHIDEQIDTLGKVTMGMTFGCARCHDHRFDPVTEKDYYRMASIFDNTKGVQHMLISRLNDIPLPGAEKKVIDVAAKYTEEFRKILASISSENKNLESKSLDTSKKKQELERKLEALVQKDSKMLKTLGLQDEQKMKEGFVRIRGQAARLGAAVNRSAPIELIPELQPTKVPQGESGRIELANWIVDPNNPLTSRVIVNRIWAQLMGKGLVESLDNFGTTGRAPSHPELLDYLAMDFMKHGWSIKYLIKKIVSSAVYQMSSERNKKINPKVSTLDPNNDFLSYYPQRRMSAEMLRDTILHISGDLDLSGIDGVLPYEVLQTSQKRSVYLPSLREEGRNHLLDVFDFPDAAASIGQRNSTNLPSQALYLMNSSFVQEQSAKTARALLSQTEGKTNEQRLRLCYQKVYGHQISDQELKVYVNYIKQEEDNFQAWTMIVHTMLCSIDFRFFN